MYLTEQKMEKWSAILDHADMPEIKDAHRRAVTATMLENQEQANRESNLQEAAPVNNTGNAANYDPILISLVRRSMPQLMAYDVCGVQPMTGPTGLVFAMRSMYTKNGALDKEALFNEANTFYSAQNQATNDAGGAGAQQGSNPADLNDDVPGAYTVGTGMTTATGEALGDAAGNAISSMGFKIDKVSVTAKTRALKANYTLELAQDLKAIHGLDAESELTNILSQEILAEMNREVIRTIYLQAQKGARNGTAKAGVFNLDVDSNGRWSVERFKGLTYQIERDCNAIAQLTRRGKGNILIVSSDVASALAMAGVLDYAPALQSQINLNVDDTGSTFAGMIGKIKVYIDPYSANLGANSQYYVAGYRGQSPYDAGLFFAPYVPLQMVRAVDPQSFQPAIGFRTRYGMVSNPFVFKADGSMVGEDVLGANSVGRNQYYSRVQVTNLV